MSRIGRLPIAVPAGVDVSIDGGVKVEHCKSLVEQGASILVAGSAVFEAKDPAGVVKQMKSAAG